MVAQVQVLEGSRALLPGERAFEIYRMIEVDGVSTRAVAQQVGLSQTRVVQLRDSVEHWVARQPAANAGMTKQQRVQAAEYKAGLRLDHLYSLALEAYRRSEGPEVSSEEASGGARVMKTRYSHGNTRYLAMAMRIAAQQSRIPVTPIVWEEPSQDELPIAEAIEEAAIPPEEDCSPRPAPPSASDVAVVESSAAKSNRPTASSSNNLKSVDATERFAADFFPVQADVRVELDDLIDEPVLTRKQRKRRARMLAALRRG